MMKCNLNCFGESAEPVPLPGGNGGGVSAESLETCRDYCLGTEGCESIVFGQNMCYGKKNVHTGKCQPSNGDFVTEVLTTLPKGTCIIMGDPHILTFDNPLGATEDTTQLTAGDYLVLQSHVLTIHGRFGYSDRFPGEASLAGLSITGDLLKGQKLTVEYRGPAKGPDGFQVWWNDAQIVQTMPADFKSDDGILTATRAMMNPDDVHNQARHTIGGNYGSGDMPSLLFNIAPGIELYVLMGDQTMNAVITMVRLPGEFDGYCGNFNCDSSDDTLPALKARGLDAPVASSLFTQPALALGGGAEQGPPKTINDCAPDVLAAAEEECKSAGDGLREGCIYDVCISGSKNMGKEDAMTAAVASGMGEKFTAFLGLQFPRLSRESLAPHLQWCLVAGVSALAVGGLAAGFSSRSGARSGFDIVRDEDDEEALLVPCASEHEPISRGAE